MCYGLLPRFYSSHEDQERVIYDENDEVSEIIFIQTGEVGVGFKLMNPLSDNRYELTSNLTQKTYFADYYVLFDVKSEFCYIAKSEV